MSDEARLARIRASQDGSVQPDETILYLLDALDAATARAAALEGACEQMAQAIEDENAARNARDLSAASCRVERALKATRALLAERQGAGEG